MSDMSTDTTTPATDRELVQIEGKARATTVMHWPELVRTIYRLRQAEAERDRLREELVKAGELLDADLVARAVAAEDERDRLREATKTTTVDALLANGRLREERDRLRDALTKTNEGWVSASTMKEDAPKWGEHFLIFRRGGEKMGPVIQADRIGIARYVPDDRTGWRLETSWPFGLSEPTHWAKIPTPPKAEEVA